MDSRITLTHGRSLSNLPLFVAESAGLFEAEGLDVEVPRSTTLSSTSDIISADPCGMLDQSARHD